MAELTSAHRNSLPKSSFGLPGERKYPINDANHARAALSRASAQRNRGALSEAQFTQIAAKAHRKLGRTAADEAPRKK